MDLACRTDSAPTSTNTVTANHDSNFEDTNMHNELAYIHRLQKYVEDKNTELRLCNSKIETLQTELMVKDTEHNKVVNKINNLEHSINILVQYIQNIESKNKLLKEQQKEDVQKLINKDNEILEFDNKLRLTNKELRNYENEMEQTKRELYLNEIELHDMTELSKSQEEVIDLQREQNIIFKNESNNQGDYINSLLEYVEALEKEIKFWKNQYKESIQKQITSDCLIREDEKAIKFKNEELQKYTYQIVDLTYDLYEKENELNGIMVFGGSKEVVLSIKKHEISILENEITNQDIIINKLSREVMTLHCEQALFKANFNELIMNQINLNKAIEQYEHDVMKSEMLGPSNADVETSMADISTEQTNFYEDFISCEALLVAISFQKTDHFTDNLFPII